MKNPVTDILLICEDVALVITSKDVGQDATKCRASPPPLGTPWPMCDDELTAMSQRRMAISDQRCP